MLKAICVLLSALFCSLSFADGEADHCTKSRSTTSRIAPHGAQFSRETIHHRDSQELFQKGFDHRLAWMTVVTSDACSKPARSMVRIKSLRIIEKTALGDERVVQSLNSQGKDSAILTGMLFNRLPNWYTSGEPNTSLVVDNVKGDEYIVDMTKASRFIWHPYTQPRIAVNPTSRYLVEATLQIVGDARVQFGIDFWRGPDSAYTGWSAGCKTSNNCEAWLSDWYGETKDNFTTIRAPKAFLQ